MYTEQQYYCVAISTDYRCSPPPVQYLSKPTKLIKTMLFLELVYLLVNLVPWNRHEFQFPPSQFSLHWWDRFLYACFSWMPEIKQKFYIPEMFVMFNPASNAGIGFAMW